MDEARAAEPRRGNVSAQVDQGIRQTGTEEKIGAGHT